MFLSLNRKIVYSILGLFLISSLVFTFTFYVAYSSKIEKDQLASIQRNQQYSDLLYRTANFIRELKQLLSQHPELQLNPEEYKNLTMLAYDAEQSNFIINEQTAIAERSKSFDEQYQTISAGITIIAVGAILLALFIIFIGYLISRWILVPINKMSQISEEVGKGNLDLRVPINPHTKYPDELDNLANTLNCNLLQSSFYL